jgi:hypothetical protein
MATWHASTPRTEGSLESLGEAHADGTPTNEVKISKIHYSCPKNPNYSLFGTAHTGTRRARTSDRDGARSAATHVSFAVFDGGATAVVVASAMAKRRESKYHSMRLGLRGRLGHCLLGGVVLLFTLHCAAHAISAIGAPASQARSLHCVQ